MSTKKILVVTATLGERDSLHRTVRTVMDIGLKDVDHLIIAPSNRCKEIELSYPHLKVFNEPEELKGIFEVLNFAFDSYGKDYEYLTFINDDDFWLPDYRLLINEVCTGKIDAVYGRVVYYNQNGDVLGNSSSSPFYRAFESLLFSNVVLMTQQAMIFRSDLFFNLNGFNNDYTLIADTDLWCRAIKRGYKFKYVNKTCAGYSFHSNQLSADTKQYDLEHKRLLESLEKGNILKRLFILFGYRLFNLGTYISRLIRNGNVFTPSKNN